MLLRTFPHSEDEHLYSVFHHRQTWLLPLFTAVFAAIIWLCVAASLIMACFTHNLARYQLAAMIATTTLMGALLSIKVCWQHPMVSVDERASGRVFTLSLIAFVAVVVLSDTDCTSIVYACHGWLLVFSDNRLVSCLHLHLLNVGTSIFLQGIARPLPDHWVLQAIYATPLLVLGTGGPVVVKCLLESHYREVYIQHYGPIDGYEATIWSDIKAMTDFFWHIHK